MFGGAPALHGGPRSPTVPLILAASTGSAGAARHAAAADRRETGGLHDCFYVFTGAPIVVPAFERLVTPIVLRWGSPARTKLAAQERAPRRRRAVAARARCGFDRPQSQGHRPRTNRSTCLTTDERTTKRRSGDYPAATAHGEFHWLPWRRQAGAPRRHRPRRDRKLSVEESSAPPFVLMVVGVSDASSKRATAVATHDISVAMSFMARLGAGGL